MISLFNYEDFCKFVQTLKDVKNPKCKLRIHSYDINTENLFLRNNNLWVLPGMNVYMTGGVSVMYYKEHMDNKDFIIARPESRDSKDKIARKGNEAKIPEKKATNSQDVAEVAQNLAILKKNSDVLPDSSAVNCPCDVNIDDGEMIQCDRCHKWSHTVCAGYFSNEDTRINPPSHMLLTSRFICVFCLKLYNHEERRAAMYRRVIDIIYNEPFICKTYGELSNKIAGRLQASSNRISRVLTELKRIGVLAQVEEKNTGSGRNKGVGKPNTEIKAMYTENAKQTIKKIFNCKKVEVYESDFYN